jgi:hypothetical protein
MAAYVTRSDCEGFQKVLYRTDDDKLRNGNKENGNVSSVRKMKALTVKVDMLQTVHVEKVILVKVTLSQR